MHLFTLLRCFTLQQRPGDPVLDQFAFRTDESFHPPPEAFRIHFPTAAGRCFEIGIGRDLADILQRM